MACAGIALNRTPVVRVDACVTPRYCGQATGLINAAAGDVVLEVSRPKGFKRRMFARLVVGDKADLTAALDASAQDATANEGAALAAALAASAGDVRARPPAPQVARHEVMCHFTNVCGIGADDAASYATALKAIGCDTTSDFAEMDDDDWPPVIKKIHLRKLIKSIASAREKVESGASPGLAAALAAQQASTSASQSQEAMPRQHSLDKLHPATQTSEEQRHLQAALSASVASAADESARSSGAVVGEEAVARAMQESLHLRPRTEASEERELEAALAAYEESSGQEMTPAPFVVGAAGAEAQPDVGTLAWV